MNEVRAVVGIDVSKAKLDIALLRNGKVKSKVMDNTPAGHAGLIAWLLNEDVALAGTDACMEATGVYFEPVALALHSAGMKVSVVNPSCIKGFGKSENIRNKNDAIDAKLIARFCLKQEPSAWTPPTLEQRQLKGWTQRLQALKDMEQQEANRLEAQSFSGLEEHTAHIKEHITWLKTEIAKLVKEIDDHIDRNPALKHDAQLILSITGIGPTTVARLLGHLGDIRRFTSAKALAAFLGVTPQQRSSGSSVRGQTMISRTGDTALRAALFMPSMAARRHNPIIKAFAERRLATGMAKGAVISAVTHKLVHLIYGVITNNQKFDPNYLSKGLAIQHGI
jgi:transposase